jgi:hypothetical protein
VKLEAIGNAPPSPIFELIKISSESPLLEKIELCEDCAETGQEINAACSFCLKLCLHSLHEWMLDAQLSMAQRFWAVPGGHKDAAHVPSRLDHNRINLHSLAVFGRVVAEKAVDMNVLV